jgi:hypothetical protein
MAMNAGAALFGILALLETGRFQVFSALREAAATGSCGRVRRPDIPPGAGITHSRVFSVAM